MGEYWQDNIAEMHSGMLLLGWRADNRFTTEEEAMITPFVKKALSLHAQGTLTPDEIDTLSLEVYKVVSFQLMNTEERAKLISSAYSTSQHLSGLISLIDQTTCCYYQGYCTCALATLFIVLESYLRALSGWAPGQPDPTFAQLRAATNRLPASPARDEASGVLNVVYARYDAQHPPQFFFNRHGLLHGLRRDMANLDRMNCARIYLLLDLLCQAEGLNMGSYVFQGEDDPFLKRNRLFRECLSHDD